MKKYSKPTLCVLDMQMQTFIAASDTQPSSSNIPGKKPGSADDSENYAKSSIIFTHD